MDGINAIDGAGGLAALRLAAEYQARVLKTQQEAMRLEGELALKLIESAVVQPPEHRLDVRV
ncbi:MAG TPA: hypothetical protein PKI11_14755 [Candidatus Hydrogenedentes bacterium]|nr:hypothetical protein [Candidatus Hydrogenedentota bacterium]HNT90003.1 hypothetical protein [Candidatus Hydrogenedentota bacterium]